jgi:ATP-dependent Lhr-like helicase
MSLAAFHPAVARWFERRFAAPTTCQERGWPAIREGRPTLIAAPTGSGKTLAAFLAAIDDLVRQGLAGTLADETQVVYVSPLKALSNDIERNLREPLAGVRDELRTLGLPEVEIRAQVRTGDTPARQRSAASRRPPHLFVTTPESLYILLTSEGGRRMLATARTVIVDEIHALVRDKRGSHLALSLERLDALCGRRLVRVGLSATQRPIEEVARFLVGGSAAPEDCIVIDEGHVRALDLEIEVPRSPLEAVMAGEVWEEVYDRLAELIRAHRTTLVFVNTRRLAERVARHLAERVGAEHVTSHHGSLSREHRLAAEERLKNGALRALVATASLELGIDIGAIDLVCQVGSVRSIAALLQRVGRSGHRLGAVSKGRLFQLSRDELVECAAAVREVRRGRLDQVLVPERPLDILAQQIVAAAAAEEWSEGGLYDLVRRAYPYRNLSRVDFDAVVEMLAEGFGTRRGRRSAYVHRDRVGGRLRGRRGARITAMTSGGAIPDTADYHVLAEPAGTLVGTLNEDYAIESLPGDVFQLGNTSWRILRVEPGRVRVEDARGQPPSIPFWLGEAPGRTAELSEAVSRLRAEVVAGTPREAEAWLVRECGLSGAGARQLTDYLFAARAALGVMPTQETLVVERFFDEGGGMQIVVHAPFGSRLNRAWGLALRKRFCQRFNFELQAAATDDALVLSLGPTHSFPLEDVFSYLSARSAREVLTQAALAAPMFQTRWRWNATRALAVPRWRGGKRVPPRLQRMQADDLLTLLFPDQVACFENLSGPPRIPDHPLVRQTIGDCLEEAMGVAELEALLGSIERGEKVLVARDLTEPSPLAQEILSARPFAFLDDAPLEERRTQAVYSRRWLDPETASDLGALDAAAIDRVREEAWPEAERAEELHDALDLLGFLTEAEGRAQGWEPHLDRLLADHRATVLGAGSPLWVAAERLAQLRALLPSALEKPPLDLPPALARMWSAEEALVEIVRGRTAVSGPVTARALALPLGLPVGAIEAALAALEAEGLVLRGRFTPGATETEWCERRLLARIHRLTLARLRQEIEPVSSADFLRFLLGWQRVSPGRRADGPEGVAALVDQLGGFEAPAAAWESEILPARLERYDPAWLDGLCLSGRVAWTRLTAPAPLGGRTPAPVRSTPIALLPRKELLLWAAPRSSPVQTQASAQARAILEHLGRRGASFFYEIAEGTHLARAEVREGIAELVAWGLVTSDGYAGLRALLAPARRPGRGTVAMEAAGRWSGVRHEERAAPETEELAAAMARALLRRYGVVFRRLLDRERLLLPWRDLLRALRRMEARGEIRGGRFVGGHSGEQYALPEAVGLLRAARRAPLQGEWVAVSGADPLNLVGILTPGERLPAVTSNRLLFRDGVPVAVRDAGVVRVLSDLGPSESMQARGVLSDRRVSIG